MRRLIAGIFLGLSTPAFAVERGAWFYYASSEPHGNANIIGNATKEDEAIRFMKQWEFKRLYGSYSSLTTTNPGAIAAWNKKLAVAGIDSYVQINNYSYGLEANRPQLLSLVDDRLIDFNAARVDPQERFVGLEMDIEVWTLPEWDAATTTARRDMLLDLRDSFAAVRQSTDLAGLTSAKLSAALPVWFDTTSTVTWSGPAEVSQWYSDVGDSLDEISLMAYETNSVATIMSRVNYERGAFPGDAHVALRTRLDLEWANMAQFTSAMTSIESQTVDGTDIENYHRLRNSLALNWDNSATDGMWAASSNWSTNITPIEVDFATFASTSPGVIGTVDLGGAVRSAGAVVFSNPSGSYTLSNGKLVTPFVTQTTNVTNTIAGDVRTIASTLTVDVQAGTVVVAGEIGDAGDGFTLNKIGAGALRADKLRVGAVAVAQGTLQLNDHAIIVAQPVASVTNMIAAGQFTSPSADPLKTLGVATAGQTGRTTFGGIFVSAGNVLVMYTYAGDANLSGHVDADDYFQIDAHYGQAGAASASYFNGDFDYNGTIDGDDYALIDAAYNGQQLNLAGVASIPEPIGLPLASIASVFAMRRRGLRV